MENNMDQISLLLVEDEEIVVELLTNFLEPLVDKIHVAPNGFEALEIYHQKKPSIVITDIHMPVMDGIALLKAIRKEDDQTHVILTSAHSDTGHFEAAINYNVDAFLLKPIRFSILKIKLQKIINQIKLQTEIDKKNKLISDVLDAQSNFTVVTEGLKLTMANKSMLDFFGYENSVDFANEVGCICEFFIEEDGYLSKIHNGKNWLDVVHENPDEIHRVKMFDQNNNEHIFIVDSNSKTVGNKHQSIVVFTDVTSLEKLNEQKINQEKQLVAQQKMASMGEMIGHIAHQWRQPLAIIGTVTSSIELKKSLGILDDEFITKGISTIDENTQYLSETISTFRNFLMEKKTFTQVILQDRIDIAIKLVNVTLKDNNIKLIKEVDYTNPISIYLVLGELIEVIINIVNNAKDVIIEKAKDDGWIKVVLDVTDDNKAILTIEDNAGGIPEHILPKIFDDGFTTKDKDTGTGLGLYMSHRIITESLKGTITASNTKNGGMFTIVLPLDANSLD
jgi:signal transduction histidine kinase/CheY-like chemotaxis protein